MFPAAPFGHLKTSRGFLGFAFSVAVDVAVCLPVFSRLFGKYFSSSSPHYQAVTPDLSFEHFLETLFTLSIFLYDFWASTALVILIWCRIQIRRVFDPGSYIRIFVDMSQFASSYALDFRQMVEALFRFFLYT